MPRPSKPLISRRRATQAALRLIDAHGLEKLSLSAVAKELGVRAPSLYYHFRNKSELLQEVARLVLVDLPDLDLTAKNYEEQIVALCVSTWRALLRHPNVAPLVLRYFPRNMLLSAYEKYTAAAPYPLAIQMAVLEATEKFTYGAALFAAAARTHGTGMRTNIDATSHPRFAEVVAANPFDEEELFTEVLRIILLGVRARVASASTGQPLDGSIVSGDLVGKDRRADDGGAGAADQQVDARARNRVG